MSDDKFKFPVNPLSGLDIKRPRLENTDEAIKEFAEDIERGRKRRDIIVFIGWVLTFSAAVAAVILACNANQIAKESLILQKRALDTTDHSKVIQSR